MLRLPSIALVCLVAVYMLPDINARPDGTVRRRWLSSSDSAHAKRAVNLKAVNLKAQYDEIMPKYKAMKAQLDSIKSEYATINKALKKEANMGKKKIISTTVELASIGYSKAEAEVAGKVRHMTVTDQVSDSACTFGTSFGFNGKTVWVDNGCRAEFRVQYQEGPTSDEAEEIAAGDEAQKEGTKEGEKGLEEGPKGPKGGEGGEVPKGGEGGKGPKGPKGGEGGKGPKGGEGGKGPKGPKGGEGPNGPKGGEGGEGGVASDDDAESLFEFLDTNIQTLEGKVTERIGELQSRDVSVTDKDMGKKKGPKGGAKGGSKPAEKASNDDSDTETFLKDQVTDVEGKFEAEIKTINDVELLNFFQEQLVDVDGRLAGELETF